MPIRDVVRNWIHSAVPIGSSRILPAAEELLFSQFQSSDGILIPTRSRSELSPSQFRVDNECNTFPNAEKVNHPTCERAGGSLQIIREAVSAPTILLQKINTIQNNTQRFNSNAKVSLVLSDYDFLSSYRHRSPKGGQLSCHSRCWLW